MSSQLMRRYADIVEGRISLRENQQLNEGMIMDRFVRPIVQKFMSMLPTEQIQDLATQVRNITGGDFSPTKENAVKVTKALGFSEGDFQQLKGGQTNVNEAPDNSWGISGTWKGKLLQAMHLGGIGAALMRMYASMNQSQEIQGVADVLSRADGTVLTHIMVIAGLILIMASNIFWDTSPKTGGPGSWGRSENKDENQPTPSARR